MKKLRQWFDKLNGKPVSSAYGMVFGVIVFTVTGFTALHITADDIDSGKTYTLAQMHQHQKSEYERIKLDTVMPPQAKEIALAALQGNLQRYLKVHPGK